MSSPRPPKELMRRVGWVVGDDQYAEVFDERGREQWRLIKSFLPADWSFTGKRSLDFGCGVGRILRHAPAEDPDGEYWGCDIDLPSIEWLQSHLSPPLHVLPSPDRPPLALPHEHFDLIWAFSVFTHLTDEWSAWMIELHRLLKRDGLLIATVFGPGHVRYGDLRVSEDVIGMNVVHAGASWDEGGPLILHSRWWLEAHWGRAFDFLDFRPCAPDGSAPLYGQGAIVMRKRDMTPTTEDLERPEPNEPREWAGLRENNATLQYEAGLLRRELDVHINSRSWRLTGPLRDVARWRRERKG